MSGAEFRYDEEYYRNYKSDSGKEYARGNGWEEFFCGIAARVTKELAPHSVLDAGCAIGFLVESFRDEGVEAEGIDISEYAISQVRTDIKPYCRVQSLLDPVTGKYDLVTCIEVLEHLAPEDVPKAISNICSCTDMVLFSSTPFEYDEESHFSVHEPAYWVEQFAYNGFYHDISYDCSYVSIQAMLFRRGDKNKTDLIRDYENVLFARHRENVAMRNDLIVSNENVRIYRDAYQKHVDMINEDLNPKILALSQEVEQLKMESREKDRCFSSELDKFRSDYSAAISALGEKEKEYRRIISAQSDRITELLKQQTEHNTETPDKEEKLFVKNYEAEVRKTRELEERCRRLNAEIADQSTELEKYRNENEKLQDLLNAAESNRSGLSDPHLMLAQNTAKSLVGMKRIWDKETKRLLALDKDYWKPVFDASFYADRNPDVAQSLGMDEGKLLEHFITMGMTEGRVASENFNVKVYIALNPDVADKLEDNLRAYYLHYITDGIKEGRRSV